MNYEEKLDVVLGALQTKETHVFPSGLRDLIPIVITSQELDSLLRKVTKDEYANYVNGYGYKIEEHGKDFLKKGGYKNYLKEKNEEKELIKRSIILTEDALRVSKRNTRWVIFGVIITIIGVAATIFFGLQTIS